MFKQQLLNFNSNYTTGSNPVGGAIRMCLAMHTWRRHSKSHRVFASIISNA
jgi:hypothetical protein